MRLHPLYEVHREQVLIECWLAPAMVVGGTHGEIIFELGLLGSSLIISWTFRILAHEEDQYTDFLYIALKQTEAGPQSMGTRFLIFARRTNSRIQEFRENDSFNSATEEKCHEFKTS